MNVRPKTITKYCEFMEFLQRALVHNPDAKLSDICKTFKVSTGIPSILRDLGVLERKGKQWVWVGEKPSRRLATTVAAKLQESCAVNKTKEPEPQAPLEFENTVAQMPVALLKQLIAEQQKTNALLEEMAQRRRVSA